MAWILVPLVEVLEEHVSVQGVSLALSTHNTLVVQKILVEDPLLLLKILLGTILTVVLCLVEKWRLLEPCSS